MKTTPYLHAEMLRQCIEDIIELAEEAKSQPDGLFKDGQLLAYNSVLSLLQINLTPDEEDYGLGFDIDKRFT